jgi:hypothetical protein
VAQAPRAADGGRADANPATDARLPSPLQIGVGFGTNFFAALGIGSFATTTALFRRLRMGRRRRIANRQSPSNRPSNNPQPPINRPSTLKQSAFHAAVNSLVRQP